METHASRQTEVSVQPVHACSVGRTPRASQVMKLESVTTTGRQEIKYEEDNVAVSHLLT